MTRMVRPHAMLSSPAKAGDPVRRGFSVLSSASLEYWVARTSKPSLRAERTNPSFRRGMDELIDFMLAHPILINRPIVVTQKGVRLCRPSEKVLELLDRPLDRFVKEDGKIVVSAKS
jgi:hypothetical protein